MRFESQDDEFYTTTPDYMESITPVARAQMIQERIDSHWLTTEPRDLCGATDSLLIHLGNELPQRPEFDPTMYWFDESMTDTLDNLRHEVPNDLTLEIDRIPAPAGIVLLARPIVGLCVDADTDGTTAVAGFLWFTSDGFWYSSEAAGVVIVPFFMSDRLGACPLGTAKWRISDRLDFHWGDRVLTDDSVRESIEEDQRLAIATWDSILCRELAEATTWTRSKKKRSGSTKRRDQPVQVIRLRGRVSTTSDGTGTKVGVRFPVRPHYRNQPCGPGGRERRRILVPGHWKGPEDAPLKVSRRIFAVTNRGDN